MVGVPGWKEQMGAKSDKEFCPAGFPAITVLKFSWLGAEVNGG